MTVHVHELHCGTTNLVRSEIFEILVQKKKLIHLFNLKFCRNMVYIVMT